MTPQQLRTGAETIREINRLLLDLEVTLDNAGQLLPASRLGCARAQLDAAAHDLKHASSRRRGVATGRCVSGEWTVQAAPELMKAPAGGPF